MSEWRAPTYKDLLGPAEGNPTVVAPCCGRPTAADMLVRVDRRFPRGTIPNDAEFICDGCRERLFMRGKVDREAFFAALGAPPEIQQRVRRNVERRRVQRLPGGVRRPPREPRDPRDPREGGE